MEKENVKAKKKFNLSQYGNVVSFLAFEVLAVIAFSLGNSYIFYTIVSAVLFVLVLLVSFRQIKIDGLTNFAIFLFPLFAFALLSAISNFTVDPNFTLANPFGLICIPLGLSLFATCGYLLPLTNKFKIQTAFLIIYSALALYVFINMIVTLVQFVPFYTFLYRDQYIYYDGVISSVPISKMAYILMGFELKEVSISYYSLFPSLLLTSSIFLFFIKYKENRKLFATYLAFTIIAALALILAPSASTIITDIAIIAVIVVTGLMIKKGWKGTVLKYILISLLALLVIFILIVIINGQYVWGGAIAFTPFQNLISSNRFLRNIFFNAYTQKYAIAVDGFLSFNKQDDALFSALSKAFGYPLIYDIEVNQYIERYTIKNVGATGSWFFDTFLTSGTFGVVFLVVGLVVGVTQLFKYYRLSDDEKDGKAAIIVFLLAFFGYSFINYDMTPLIFSRDVYPFFISAPFMISLFLLSYCISKRSIAEEKIKEENKKQEIEKKNNQKEGMIDEEIAL